MGTAAGLDWVVSQNIRTHKLGLFKRHAARQWFEPVGLQRRRPHRLAKPKGIHRQIRPRVLGAGDVITVTDMYAVNPVSTDALSDLRQFTVLADVNSDGSGNATAIIYPPIIPPGTGPVINPYATVSTLVVDGTPVRPLRNRLDTVAPGDRFPQGSLCLGCVPLDMPTRRGGRLSRDRSG